MSCDPRVPLALLDGAICAVLPATARWNRCFEALSTDPDVQRRSFDYSVSKGKASPKTGRNMPARRSGSTKRIAWRAAMAS
jgi:hypothetical protein